MKVQEHFGEIILGIPEFTTQDTYEMSGKGTVHVIELPKREFIIDMIALIGQKVKLDGEDVIIKDIECYALSRGSQIDRMGILI